MSAARSPLAGAISELAELETPEERDRWLDEHPDAAGRESVVALCRESVRLLRVDLTPAMRLAEAACQIARRLQDPWAVARAVRARANVAHRGGDYLAALGDYERALAIFEELEDELEVAITQSSALHNLIYHGRYDQAFSWADRAARTFHALDDQQRLGRLELNRGNILYRLDRWQEARALYESAYRRFLEVGVPADVANTLRNLAVCLTSLNDFEAAHDAYRRARDFCREHDMPLVEMVNEYNIAYLYYLRGEYTQAIQRYQTARRESEALGDDEHTALCDLDQAEIFLELNLVDEATQLGQSAYERFDRLGMRYEAAKALTNMAIAMSRRGKEFLALELLSKAREIFVAEGNQVWPAQLDLYRALVLYGEGRHVESRALAQSAAEVFDRLTIPGKAAMCQILLARLDLESDRHREALEQCTSALALLDRLNVPALEYQAYFVLGQVQELSGDRPGALAAYRRSHEMLERLRSHLQTDELKITFLEDKLVVYENLVTLLLDEPSEDNRHAAFGYVEKAKSRGLADLMAFRAHALPARSATRNDLVDQIRGLREELNWYYRQIDLRQMQNDRRNRDQVEALRQESRRREENLVRTLRELQTTDQEFSSLQDATTVELGEIQRSIPEGTRLIEFYVARGVIHAWLIGRDTLQVETVTISSRARELHRKLQFQLSKYLMGHEYVTEFGDLVDTATHTHLRALFDELLAPFGPRLDCEHLIVVPHDFLHHVPFQALHDGERYLVDRFSISYAPSASVYHLCVGKERESGDQALVLGVADDRAPRILDEARAVAEVLGNATLRLDEEAGEEELRELGPSSRIVHIATHGVFRRDNPMFSAIQLGRSRLSLFDLYSLELTADLVVLSGCGTGLNVVLGADELVGLARGLLYAGAHSVLVTLWDVNDESTTRFMRSFYRHLREHPTAEALGRAMRETRESYEHPYYWAPFVLVGRPRFA